MVLVVDGPRSGASAGRVGDPTNSIVWSLNRLFDKPADAEAFTKSKTVGTTMDRVRKFLFEKELLGKGAKSVDAVGIELGDKSVLCDKANVKLRFDATYMDEAAKGKL